MIRSKLIVIGLVLGFISCKNEKDNETKEVTRPVRAMQVGMHEEFGTRKFPGRAEASNATTLAFEVPGKLNEITVAVGDKVRKGAVLASVDSRDYRNTLDQARAELKRSEAQYQRVSKAAIDNAVSRQDVTNAEAAYESAKATVRIREKALEDTRLKAPYEGIVVAKYVESYENIQAKQNAVRLVDPSRIEMVADIPEDIISLAEIGMEIYVEFDAFPGLVITSKISEIGTEASQTTRTYPVTLIMDQPEGNTILPGMAGRAWRSPNTVISDDVPENLRGYEVPLSAILSGTDGKKYVWVINAETGSVSQQEIQTGDLTGTGVLVQGLEGGETIATAGVNSLQEGQSVRIIK